MLSFVLGQRRLRVLNCGSYISLLGSGFFERPGCIHEIARIHNFFSLCRLKRFSVAALVVLSRRAFLRRNNRAIPTTNVQQLLYVGSVLCHTKGRRRRCLCIFPGLLALTARLAS